MQTKLIPRYSDVAIGLHWLIAALIIGLLAVGKYMTGLDSDDPVRFVLTQWHKTFGIAVLLLSVIRLLWRLSHRPPPEPESLPAWQKRVAHLVHLALYGLLFAVPISGWILVSVSPLNIETLLFDVIPWPHLPFFADAADKDALAHSFEEYHELAGNVLLLLLLAHVGAALKHHFIDKDSILTRMLPDGSRRWYAKLAIFVVATSIAAGGLTYYANGGRDAALLAAGDSEVSFVAGITGDSEVGTFPASDVTATLNAQNPSQSVIEARVETGGIMADNAQMAASLPGREWFESETHPEALFVSREVLHQGADTLTVNGTLTIKAIPVEVSFPMTLADEDGKRVARGEFVVDRRDFQLGLESQESDEFVDYPVTIRFRFDMAGQSGA